MEVVGEDWDKHRREGVEQKKKTRRKRREGRTKRKKGKNLERKREREVDGEDEERCRDVIDHQPKFTMVETQRKGGQS